MGGLLGSGEAQQKSALKGLGTAATLETSRENASEQLNAAHDQQVLGSTASGAMIGAQVGGGWGALAGGIIGFVAGELM